MAKKRKVDEEELETLDTKPDENSDSDEEEDLTKLLEPFNKEQLIDLLRSAASTDPKILEEIHRVADQDPSHRKLFVHGLGWETTSEKLREFFSQFGELEDSNVVADKVTGKSKGYGFILFKHRRDAQKALKEPQKKIESRMTACQLASAGPVHPSQSNPNMQQQQQQMQQQVMHPNQYPIQDNLPRKIYVGNVHSDIPADRLFTFFSKYGEIEEGPLGFDKLTGKSKGFALFIYKTVEGARKALEEPNKSFEGHQLYCQKATDNHKFKSAAGATSVSGNLPSGSGFNAPGVGGGGFNIQGVGGFGAPGGGGAGFNAPNGAMAHQASAASNVLLGQGFFGPFGQGMAQNQAALAVLAAAGQNPAAFGVSPAVLASLNPALAAAMNAGQQPMASSNPQQAMQGYGMVNPGYQNPQAHQATNAYQSGPVGHGHAPRSHSAVGPMGGYGAH